MNRRSRLQFGDCWLWVGLVTALAVWLAVATWVAAGGEAVPTLPMALADSGTASTGVITLGVAVSLPGIPDLGWRHANAVQLAVEQQNAAGGLDLGGVHYSVTLVTGEDSCSPGNAVTTAHGLIDAGAVAVVGHDCSSAANAAQSVYAAAGVPMMSASATGPFLTEGGYDTTFRLVTRDDNPSILLAGYVRDVLGLQRAAIVGLQGFWGNWALDTISSTFTTLGGTVTSWRTVADTAAFTATLAAIKHEDHPDVIFYADDNPTHAGLLSHASHDLGMDNVPMAWAAGVDDRSLLADYAEAAGAAALGDCVVLFYRGPADMPGYAAFRAAYQAAGFPNYGEEPLGTGAYAYDAARILLAAIDRADSADPAAIRDAVAATADFDGVVGTYLGFDAKGDVIPQWMSLWQYVDGYWQPAPAAEPMVAGWTDPFDGPLLHSRWSWVREDASSWSLTTQPGSLVLMTKPTSLWAQYNTQHNLLLTAAPPGDFRITTRLEFAPVQNYHQAGLLVYQDDDNYLKLNRQFADGQKVEMIGEIGGVPVYTNVVQALTRVYLQVRRNGDRYTGYYSLDGQFWLRMGTFTAALTALQVGLHANHDIIGPSPIPAAFDFFQVAYGRQRLYLPLVPQNLTGLGDLSGL